MKYLFIKLVVRDGEREYNLRVLHTTNCKNIDFAAIWYVAHFWGIPSYTDKDLYYHFGGETATSLYSFEELTETEYNYLNEFLYG